MPKFVIERKIPSAGKLSPKDLQGIAQKSCGALREPQVHWVQSYVTDDKIHSCTSPQTRPPFAGMPRWEDSQRTPSPRFAL